MITKHFPGIQYDVSFVTIRAVKDCTYVIHVASPLPTGNPRNDMELIGPAVDGTKSVLEACAKTKGGVKRVVLTSSCGAIMGKKTGAIDTCKGKDCHIVTSMLIASKSLKLLLASYLSVLFVAGRIGEDHIFTEEDWSSLEGSSPYEKSKHLAEKAAWELVKDLPGYQQTYST